MTDDVVERVGRLFLDCGGSFDRRIFRALSALRPGDELPGGMVVVPKVATGDMIWAGGQAQSNSIGSYGEPAIVWSAMLAAAKEVDE
jgi:hypothetical protein